MAPQTIAIRTLRTYTYRPLTPSPSTSSSSTTTTTSTPCTTASSSPIDAACGAPLHPTTSLKSLIRSSKPTSRVAKPARHSVHNLAWPSKQCAKTSATRNTQLSAVLEDYLLLLEQQRDQVASRGSTREGTPVGGVE